MRCKTSKVVVLMVAAVIAGCGGDPEDQPGLPENTDEAIATYARIVLASYEDSLAEANALKTAVQTFVAAPSEANLDAAKAAWRASREPYLQTEVYRFYDGPIDGTEGLMNSWPLDEAYIDYVEGAPTSGIINDPAVTLDETTLESLNEQGGEENIATGYHAIEFLLWGQDFNDDGPGNRPYTDYLSDGGTAENQDRRATYLTAVTGMLVGHLEGLTDAWRTGDSGNYRAEFEGAAENEAMRRILTGMIVLSGFETGGERLQTAYDSGDQEDEHSCFSDNTHRDMIQDIQGIKNVWTGNYSRLDGSTVSGVGLGDVVRAAAPDLAAQLDERIDESLRLANELSPPFDQEIAIGNAEGRARVQALISSLRKQEQLLQDVFRLFNLTIQAPE